MRSHAFYWLLSCLLGVSLQAQNLSWLSNQSIGNTQNGPAIAKTNEIALDAQGNVYSVIEYSGSITISTGGVSISFPTAENSGVIISKYSPVGERLWSYALPFLGRPKISVNDSGDLVLAATLFEGTDTIFQGQRIQTEGESDALFLASFDTAGNLNSWLIQRDFYEGFELREITGLELFEDGDFLMSAVFFLDITSNDPIIPFTVLDRYSFDLQVLQSNRFEWEFSNGQRRSEIAFNNVQTVNNETYVRAQGFGAWPFLPPVTGPPQDHPVQSILSIDEAGELELFLDVEDPSDFIYDFVVHRDGSLSLLGFSLDGLLETSWGDFVVPENQGFLANISQSNLNAVIPTPENVRELKAFENDDNRLLAFTSFNGNLEVFDGRGNQFTASSGGSSNTSIILTYTKSGLLSFFEVYDLPDGQGEVQVFDAIGGDICDALYVAGSAGGLVDFDLSDDNQLLSDPRIGSGHFLARYSNEPPRIETPARIEFCMGDIPSFELTILDEAADQVTVGIESDSPGFAPNDLTITGTGITRTVGFPNTALMADITLRIRVTDLCNGFTEKEIVLAVTPAPRAPLLSAMGTYFLCPGDTLKLTSDAVNNPLWSTGDTQDTLAITLPGEYWLFQQSDLGCQGESSDTLRVIRADPPVIPTITASGALTLCEGDSVVLTANGAESVLWSTGETSPSITVRTSGTYTVQAVSENCGLSDASAATIVQVIPVADQPLITVLGSSRICEGETVVLRSSAPVGNLWSTGETTREITVQNAGQYSVRVGLEGCPSPESELVVITVDEAFDLIMPVDTTVCGAFGAIELVPQVSRSGLSYLWSDGSTGPSLSVTEAGEYWVEISNGTCVQRAFTQVEELCLPVLYMPTAFSPNGDEQNDTFGPVADRIVSFQMKIYSSAGQLLFISNGVDEAWDGTFRGERQPAGHYVYQVAYSGIIRGRETAFTETKGFVLVR